jgi:ssRNA-specific RNase YbeY (16S rRNA maturation enzyme)
MTIIPLETLKGHMRVLDGDLDLALQLALAAAEAEAGAFLGAELDTLGPDLPGDIVMSILLLAQAHADAGTVQESEWRRTAAHNLLRPHRLATGIGGIA